ncbi:flagellar hook-basal body complex protein FliE [Propylenella binzhouense]|uniref:Flagellar hook-basal body complex protein FliE n=1 Tax=Propylenella binzhouense TaxID=2555902 RepID=A0A964T262_9HYPH|nr:flagellar hook-basal body complex protein FliE [Propylenella binzhouense]MYZ46980.1 flagellar hook-basal body complex protein FliE [Propylenella binzhouense]
MTDTLAVLSSSFRGISGAGSVHGAASAARTAAAAPASGAADFGSVLAQVSAEAVGTLHAGEAAAISGIEGKAPVQQVVEAVMSAEQTLQAAIAIRDKVVAAYQEISRMAI